MFRIAGCAGVSAVCVADVGSVGGSYAPVEPQREAETLNCECNNSNAILMQVRPPFILGSQRWFLCLIVARGAVQSVAGALERFGDDYGKSCRAWHSGAGPRSCGTSSPPPSSPPNITTRCMRLHPPRLPSLPRSLPLFPSLPLVILSLSRFLPLPLSLSLSACALASLKSCCACVWSGTSTSGPARERVEF